MSNCLCVGMYVCVSAPPPFPWGMSKAKPVRDNANNNKTKVISANLLDFDLDFEGFSYVW